MLSKGRFDLTGLLKRKIILRYKTSSEFYEQNL